MYEYPLYIPEYSDGQWHVRTIHTHEEFLELVWSNFKMTGEYNLDERTLMFKEAANYYDEHECYTETIPGTAPFIKYWTAQTNKCKNGVIINGFYLPGFFYFYLNFCRIYHRKKRKESFPDVFDSDYRFFLYILLCILLGKHAVVVKTRQRGYSYKIMAILTWSYWFWNASVNTVGASDEEYTQKSWEYINTYRNHLNSQTAWIRGPYPMAKNLDWVERTALEEGGYAGNNSKLKGLTFKQSPTKGVGGAQTFFFYEEAGIAPTLLTTIGYIRPAVEMGNITTGTIIVSGSVGELDQCQDLKKIFESPASHNFLGLPNVFEDGMSHEMIGFFVPDSWSLEGYIDRYGNSLVKDAEAFIRNKRKIAEESKRAEEYQLEVSQSPLTPSEAFAYRKRSFFPSGIINKQQERIDKEKPPLKPVILFEAGEKINWRIASQDGDPKPIRNYPLKDSEKDFRGCVEILDFPHTDNPAFLDYFAGVDPIATDSTTTSESLFSVTIFRNLTEIKDQDEEGKPITKITGFYPVAWYVGRMEDLKQTNQIGEYLIRMYNAFAVIESNVQTFINHMQSRNMQRYMATKKDIGFLEDLHANQNVHKVYGVHMTPVIKSYLLQNIKDYMQEETEVIRKPDGEIVRTVYGVERIKDTALLQEAKMYREGNNTDRLISFGLALSLAKHYVINGMFNRVDKTQEKEKKERPVIKRSYFRTLDNELQPAQYARPRSYFKYHK